MSANKTSANRNDKVHRLSPALKPSMPKASSRPMFTKQGMLASRTSTRATRRVADCQVLDQAMPTPLPIMERNCLESPLLRLPAELRNTIYDYALVTDTPLVISGPEPSQPGITRACKQTRSESLRIFYTRNSFSCVIQNYDPVVFKQYRKIADKHGLSTVLLTHRHVPDVTREILRTNLLAWLVGTYEGETAPLGYSSGHTEETFKWEKLSHRIVKVFNIAKEMRKTKVDKATARMILENAVDAAGICGEKKK